MPILLLRTHLLAVLIGAWIGCTLMMWVVATVNFRTVDRVLSRPTSQAAPPLSTLPEAARRPVLRHLSSELNRRFFWLWGSAQVLLGIAVLVLLLGQAPRRALDVGLAAALVILVVILVAAITPAIVRIGREIDFLPRVTPPPQMAAFGRLHAAYSALDLVKLILLIVLTWRITLRPG